MGGTGLRPRAPERERGQASLLLLGVVAALLVGVLVLFGFGQALGARGKHQRAAGCWFGPRRPGTCTSDPVLKVT